MECLFALAISSLSFMATASLLFYTKFHNEIEQQRARAHQIVTERLEIERFQLFTWTQTGDQVTVWDNNTPDNPDDDTVGSIFIVVRNALTDEILTVAPSHPAFLVQVEATLIWAPKTRPNRIMRETAMTFKSPS